MHAPFALTADSGGDQFTVTGAVPRLSWKFSPDARTEVRHELEALIDGVPAGAASRTVSGHRFIVWPWGGLRSGQRVHWRVRTVAAGSRSDWSGWASFEAGLLSADWTASWISPVESDDAGYGKRPAYVLATKFRVTDEVRSARLYATALGVYTATINGERVGSAEPSPPRLDLLRSHPLRPGLRCHRHSADCREPARNRTVRRLVPRAGRRFPHAGRLGHDPRRAGGASISSTPMERARSSAAMRTGRARDRRPFAPT